MIREPAVAGYFYSGSRKALAAELQALIREREGKIKALGVVCPHAGYIYSGSVAGAVYSAIEVPQSAIIMCPNHTGLGKRAAIMSEGQWGTPLGVVEINGELARTIKKESALLEEDHQAHLREHALEVQLPFLQSVRADFKLVPICISGLSFEMCRELGYALARAVRESGSSALIVASTDMTHYEPHQVASRKDRRAIDKIIALDAEGLFRTVRDEDISMCGYIPTTVMLVAVVDLGATRAELIRYQTSGEVSGDYEQVVGYAGVVIS